MLWMKSNNFGLLKFCILFAINVAIIKGGSTITKENNGSEIYNRSKPIYFKANILVFQIGKLQKALKLR